MQNYLTLTIILLRVAPNINLDARMSASVLSATQRGNMLKEVLFVILVLGGKNRCTSGQCVGIEKSLFDSPFSQLTCTKEVVPGEQVPPDTFCVVRWATVIFISMYVIIKTEFFVQVQIPEQNEPSPLLVRWLEQGPR